MPMPFAIYQFMKGIRDAQNEYDEQNKLPTSLDRAAPTRKNKKLPRLCLRTRLAIEKALNIYEPDDLRALKITSMEQRIIC